jgi:hypothetical protein
VTERRQLKIAAGADQVPVPDNCLIAEQMLNAKGLHQSRQKSLNRFGAKAV